MKKISITTSILIVLAICTATPQLAKKNLKKGMFEALKWGLQFKIPIIVTENGIEDADDDLRPSYIIQHLHQIWRGVNFNWPIKGYFYWTLVDNFEWERGYGPRFGLVRIDYETLERIPKQSAYWYRDLIANNVITL